TPSGNGPGVLRGPRLGRRGPRSFGDAGAFATHRASELKDLVHGKRGRHRSVWRSEQTDGPAQIGAAVCRRTDVAARGPFIERGGQSPGGRRRPRSRRAALAGGRRHCAGRGEGPWSPPGIGGGAGGAARPSGSGLPVVVRCALPATGFRTP